MDCSPPGSSVHGDSPSKDTGMGFHSLLQGIFLTQGLNPGLWHCRQILQCLSHQGKCIYRVRSLAQEHLLQYSLASLVAQSVKNLPVMQETWVWSLSWEDPLEKGMATHSIILPWGIPWAEETCRLQSMEWKELDMTVMKHGMPKMLLFLFHH